MVLLVPVFLYDFGYNYYLIVTEKFWKNNDAGPIYLAIKKSKKKTNKKKIIISDSVGAQLFPIDKKYDSIYTLSTTAPSSLVGSYILLQNLSEYNSLEGATVYYVVHPSSLNDELRGKYTYNHFVKPFYNIENRRHITPLADSLVNTIPFLCASQLPFVKTSNWQPDFDYKKVYKHKISKLYIEYFKRIKNFSEKEKFTFKVIMPFVRQDQKNRKYKTIKNQIKENKLDYLFVNYFKNIIYFENNFFHSGSNHYKSTNKIRVELREKLILNGLEESIKANKI